MPKLGKIGIDMHDDIVMLVKHEVQRCWTWRLSISLLAPLPIIALGFYYLLCVTKINRMAIERITHENRILRSEIERLSCRTNDQQAADAQILKTGAEIIDKETRNNAVWFAPLFVDVHR